MEVIFTESGVRYERGAVSEGRSKPDFLFPGGDEYRNPEFDAIFLTMLGVKSSCKDRWRQVLTEARKIERKHLLTLETAISQNQTDQMRDERLQLVLPKSLHGTYTLSQQNDLLDVEGFIREVQQKQARMIVT
jgi:hypothetical protein